MFKKNPKDPDKKAMVVDFVDSGYDADKIRSEWLTNLSEIN